jgi:hypothetical protein
MFKIFCLFLYCNNQVNGDFLNTLYTYVTCEWAQYRLSALQEDVALGRALLLRLLWGRTWLPHGRYATTTLPSPNSHLSHAQISHLWLRTNGTRIRFLYPLHIYRAIQWRKKKLIYFPLRSAFHVTVVPSYVTRSRCSGSVFRDEALIYTKRRLNKWLSNLNLNFVNKFVKCVNHINYRLFAKLVASI